MKLFNTLTKKIEEFKPLVAGKVGLYTCGPTVYDYTHIGHLRKYIEDDILRRVLLANGYEVKHVMNITDVGHLTSDEDAGEDKLEKGAKDRGMSVWEVAKFFEDYFFKSLEKVNILRPHIVAKATDHVNEQIKLIEKLEKQGLIYQTPDAIYFDISKFPNYGKLAGQNLANEKVGARPEVIVDSNKRNPQDFALWFFTVGRFKDHVMRWPSPWGEGFPGWHIECSAISMEYLGNTLDIHTGGVDHIPLHHTNEIAQSEGATGKQFVRYWVHHEHLMVDGEKMSKSKKNFYTIDDIRDKGFDPLSLRYLFLTGHYRDHMNFTWESLQGAQNTLNKIRDEIRLWQQSNQVIEEIWQKFLEAANNDLNIPQAVVVLHELLASDYPTSSKSATILKMDEILGLGLADYLGKPLDIPAEVMKLVHEREIARKSENFKTADNLRKKISDLGFTIEDTPNGPKIRQLKV